GEGGVGGLGFAGEGKTLVWGSFDRTALVWDLTKKLPAAEKAPARALTKAQLQKHWDTLGKADAINAYQAINTMVRHPKETVAFLKEQLQPVTAEDVKKLKQLVNDLDSNKFKVREKATEELEKLGESVEPLRTHALTLKPTLEMRKRLEKLLDRMNGPVTSAARLRVLRAVEVLEHVGNQEAQQLLESYSKGAAGIELTLEATAALERLGKR